MYSGGQRRWAPLMIRGIFASGGGLWIHETKENNPNSMEVF